MQIPASKLESRALEKRAEFIENRLRTDPSSLGIKGILSRGIDSERMAKLAREYEEKEAKRIGTRIIQYAHETIEEKGETIETKEARAIPAELDSRWPWMARRSELEIVLKERFGVKEDLSGTSLKDLRGMVKDRRSGGDGSGRSRQKRKTRSVRAPRPAFLGPDPPALNPAPEKQTQTKNKRLHCIHCGFLMEITRVAFESLADGGDA